MTIEVPFDYEETAYISDQYYCAAGQATPCVVKGYSMWGRDLILARCFVQGYGIVPFRPEHLYRTKDEAIRGRADANVNQ